MKAPRLDERFADLEPYLPWALASESERIEKRVTSTMEEIQAFYDAMSARSKEVVDYLNGYPLEDLPEEALTLLHMSLSLMEVSNAVQVFKQPTVIDGLDARRFEPIE